MSCPRRCKRREMLLRCAASQEISFKLRACADISQLLFVGTIFNFPFADKKGGNASGVGHSLLAWERHFPGE